MKLTKYGTQEWLGSGLVILFVIFLVLLVSTGPYLSLGLAITALLVLAWLCIAAFFRDPHRHIPEEPNVFVAPADGVIRDIEPIQLDSSHPHAIQKFKRIGIFLSVLDVHLNRAPCDFTIQEKKYKKGVFHDARDIRASKENESMTLAGNAEMDGKSFPIAVKQISGAIATRIVCAVNLHDSLKKGQKYGMIKFGSRTELYLPDQPEFELNIKVGDRVIAGTTVLATLRRRNNEKEIP